MEASHSSSPPAFEVLCSLEYLKSVSYPVYSGEIFNDRYRILRQLGHGRHGSVWLVEDTRLNRFASLKILATDASSVSCELHISRYLQSLQERNITHPGRDHVVQILDTFTTTSPNGTHHCIVTELLGKSMAEEHREFYKEQEYEYPEDITRKVAAQVALAVSYLRQFGVIHGDLSLGNVLFYSPKLQSMLPSDVTDIYGPPGPDANTFLNPPSVTLRLLTLCLSSVNQVHAKICDFSAATLINEVPVVDRPFVPHMPVALAAPEVIFNDIPYPTTSMDIWALGVLLFMIMNAKHPPFISSYNAPINEVIMSMVTGLGKLPDKWWRKWSERAEFFDEDGVHNHHYEYLRGCRKLGPQGIANGLHKMDVSKVFTLAEREELRSVMCKIFRYDPEERINADEIVHSLPRGWVDPQVLEKLDRIGNGTVVVL